METPFQRRVRERAYELWDAAGRAHGQAEQHWLAAEREVLAEMTAQLPAASAGLSPGSTRRKRIRASIGAQRRKSA